MAAQDFLARRVRELTSRKRSDLRPNLTEIAKALGVGPGAITNWLKGDRRITLDDAENIAKALGMPIGQLVDEHAIEMTPDELHFLYFVRSLDLDHHGIERAKRVISAAVSPVQSEESARTPHRKHGGR
jgi:transcriptional regulator with XRE-family HTH domain